MGKVDFKKQLKELYLPSNKEFVIVEVPEMQFVMIDGDPRRTAPEKLKTVLRQPVRKIAL